jgi:hypothetical protein
MVDHHKSLLQMCKQDLTVNTEYREIWRRFSIIGFLCAISGGTESF